MREAARGVKGKGLRILRGDGVVRVFYCGDPPPGPDGAIVRELVLPVPLCKLLAALSKAWEVPVGLAVTVLCEAGALAVCDEPEFVAVRDDFARFFAGMAGGVE